MDSRNEYRNKCIMLMNLLEQRNREVDELKSLLESQSTISCPALAAMEVFHKTIVTAERNSMAYHKGKVTDKKQGYVEINYRNFWDITQEVMQDITVEDLPSYKDVLQDLQLVASGSFESGGIPSRVEGRTMRVVRVPAPVYRLMTEGECVQV